MSDVADYTDLTAEIETDLPSCPAPLILRELRRAGREFLHRSEVWEEELTLDIVEDQTEYTLVPTHDASIFRVLKVELNGIEQTEDRYEFKEESTLVIDWTPTEDDDEALVVDVSLCSYWGSIEIPGWIIDRWGDAICSGAKSSLQAMPAKPWSNVQMAGVWRQRFRQGINSAKMEVLRRREKAHRTMEIPFWS